MRALEQQSETAAHWAEREYDALFAPEAPPRLALVACNEVDPQQILGFVIARLAGSECEIENVVVGAEYRRRGVGSVLVRDLLLRARLCGATSVVLEVRESNASARRLYEKLGFSEHGRRRSYYQNPREDALLFQFSVAVL
jgi:ribosomal-protein-alanine acetyltransferase